MMKRQKYSLQSSNPAAVGGMGGSGTRLVAAILQSLCFYMGGDLNESRDNLWFTLLFKRPRLFDLSRSTRLAVIRQSSRIFTRAMLKGIRFFNMDDSAPHVERAVHDMVFDGRHMGAGEAQGQSIAACRAPDDRDYAGWGWKEPNTYVFLEDLNRSYRRMKYIHVIRHGLDMAYASNVEQALNWGRLFGVAPRKPITPNTQLQYWARMNERVVNQGLELLGDRFLLISLEDLCRHRESSLRRLVDFLEISVSEKKLQDAAAIPIAPKTLGRYRDRDLTIFTSDELEPLAKWGYQVNEVSRCASLLS